MTWQQDSYLANHYTWNSNLELHEAITHYKTSITPNHKSFSMRKRSLLDRLS
ncbi:MAG: hypothetical protein KME32_13005 [Mojavia pulchra JT2-VF2]|uniref:Uncharacterized protein n=1 Tax=Mojavia pulchra JT2-VF2 TaxID=287848 RepID=A0A951Q098_9NOST|nr:hypothetical protein [Mojavia pulchra JT2-VF2]